MEGLHFSNANCDTSTLVSHESGLICDTSSSSMHNFNAVTACNPNTESPNPALYEAGFTITAWRHHAPEPFGWGYNTKPPKKHPKSASVLCDELCTSRKSREGQTQYGAVRHFTITSTLRTGMHCGPQLVVMNDILVAKIYDPVYYNPREHADATWSADKSYSREVAAYEHLQNITSVSDIVPAFYGAWTFNIATEAIQEGILTSSTRLIRMILMERLEGQCMEAIDPKSISDLARTTILKQCLDAEVRLHHAGVNHGDVCPRNIMVLGSSPESSDVHIKFIDFDVSLVLHHPNLEYPGVLEMQQNFSRLWSPKLSSPIVRFFGGMMEFSCRGWCPGGRRGAEQWLWQNYAHDDRYAPVQWDPNEKRKDPVYLNPLEQCHEPVSVVGHAIMTPSNSATDTYSRLNTTDDSVNKK